MKNIISTIFLFLLPLLSIQAQVKFKNSDINGEWKSSGGYTITISDGNAHLTALGEAKYPKKLLGSLFYGDIKQLVENRWSARTYQWRYVGKNAEDGRWVDEGMKVFVLSNDKNSLTEGTRNFTRINTKVVDEASMEDVANNLESNSKSEPVNVDYAGLKVRYTVNKLNSGKTVVLIQAVNSNVNLTAFVTFKIGNEIYIKTQINPLIKFTATIPANDFFVEVNYKVYEGEDKSYTDIIINKLKNIVRDHVVIEGGGIKTKMAAIGVRG